MSIRLLLFIILVHHLRLVYGRYVLQSEDNVLVITSEEELQNAMETLAEGQIIELDSATLQLSQRLLVNVSGVEIRGRRQRAVLRCPENDNALIATASIVLRNLRFEGCSGAVAVLVEPPENEESLNASISLNNVHFRRNAGSLESTGASFHVIGCNRTEPCSNPPVSINIEDSVFRDNTGLSGSAISCDHCDLRITQSEFRNNIADFSGGGIYLTSETSRLNITDSTFENNEEKFQGSQAELRQTTGLPLEALNYFFFRFPTGSGGAITTTSVRSISITGSTFSGNQAAAGGALSLMYDTATQTDSEDGFSCAITNCTFSENQARSSSDERNPDPENNLGGAIYLASNALDLSWSLSDVQFIKNKARYGGALHMVTHSLTEPEISQCLFEENDASGNGGGILARNTGGIELEESSFTRNSAAFGGAIMLTNGAMLTCQGLRGIDPNQRTGRPTRFTDNSATDGGGVLCVACGDVRFEDTLFVNNLAERIGGGIHFLDTRSQVIVQHAQFLSNRATQGGGAAFVSTQNIRVNPASRNFYSLFQNNSAISGAGIYVKANRYKENQFQIKRARFVNNTATGSENGAILDSSSSTGQSQNDCSNGGGGGICLVIDEVPENLITDIRVSEVNFTRNSASVGAGMFVEVAGELWNNDTSRDRCPSASPFREPCRLLVFESLRFRRNQAEFGGGAMFVSHPEKVLIGCEENVAADHSPLNAVFDSPEKVCLDFQNNTVKDSNGTYGPNIASRVYSLLILSPLNPIEGLKGGTRILPPCESCPEDRTEGIIVAIKDAFDQTITGGIADSRFHVTLISASILGDQIYQAQGGRLNINSTIGTGINSTSELVIRLDENPDIHANLTFSTRACYPGETRAGNECDPCDATTFSFNSSVDCKTCPSQAECTGRASLVPRDGYWHSSPFSTQFHECIVKEACKFDNRTEQLAAYYENITRVSSDLALLEDATGPQKFENYTQCAEGYRGVLCGSCEAGYGHFAGGECIECPDERGSSALVIFLLVLWVSIIISANIVMAFLSSRKQIQIAEAQQQQIANSSGPNNGVSQQLHSPSNGNSVTASGMQSLDIEQPLPKSSAPSNQGSGQTRGLREVAHVIALERGAELLKIFINYCQITGTALTIDVAWLGFIKFLLAMQNLFMSVMNGSNIVPLDCSLDQEDNNGTPQSIQSLWLRISLPFMLLVVFLGLVQVYIRFIRTSRTGNNMATSSQGNDKPLWTYSIVVAIVLIYYSYIDLTSEFMRAFSCIEVDEKDDGEEEYQKYALATGRRFWAEDTSLRCFRGKHAATGVLGILGLIFFSSTVIVCVCVWILKHQKVADSDPLFIARYGFLYQGYDPKRKIAIIWESVIFIRKALIAVVIVFAFHLGANLQAICALGVLILSLAVHMIFQPFKHYDTKETPAIPRDNTQKTPPGLWSLINNHISLNWLEAASLVCSIVVFYSGIMFNDENTSDAGKITMAAFAFTLNLVYILYIMYRLYAGLVVALDLHLEKEAPPGVEIRTGKSNPISVITKAIRLGKYLSQAKQKNHPGFSRRARMFVPVE